jgi:hypothetical protein
VLGRRDSLGEAIDLFREESRRRDEERAAEARRREEARAAEAEQREAESRKREAEAHKREAAARKREAEARRREEETREFNREILLRNEKVYTSVIRQLEENTEQTRANTQAVLKLLDRFDPPGGSMAA